MSIHDIVRRGTYTLAVALAISASAYPSMSMAADNFKPYKISMKRTNPAKPLPKSEIIAKVKSKHDGRVLSIRDEPRGGEDCHIVNQMGEDGELRIIHVACTKEW